MEVGGVGGAAAARPRSARSPPGRCLASRRAPPCRRARGGVLVGGRDQQQEVAVVGVARRVSGADRHQPGEACERSTTRAPRSARVSTRARQSPSSGAWGRARAMTTTAPSPRPQPSSSAAGDDVLAVGHLAAHEVLEEVAAPRPRWRARGRSSGRPRARSAWPPSAAGPGSGRSPRGRKRSSPTHRVGHPQLDALAGALARPSPRARRRATRRPTASTLSEASRTIALASSARPGRAGDRGQAGARLDRVGDLLEELQEGALAAA